jgi:hypothetical protein
MFLVPTCFSAQGFYHMHSKPYCGTAANFSLSFVVILNAIRTVSVSSCMSSGLCLDHPESRRLVACAAAASSLVNADRSAVQAPTEYISMACVMLQGAMSPMSAPCDAHHGMAANVPVRTCCVAILQETRAHSGLC